jgi:hypothetical protein
VKIRTKEYMGRAKDGGWTFAVEVENRGRIRTYVREETEEAVLRKRPSTEERKKEEKDLNLRTPYQLDDEVNQLTQIAFGSRTSAATSSSVLGPVVGAFSGKRSPEAVSEAVGEAGRVNAQVAIYIKVR